VHVGFWWGNLREREHWEDNIKMIYEVVGRDVGLIDLAEDRDRWRAVVNAVMNLLRIC
jgi:hypothetical protein